MALAVVIAVVSVAALLFTLGQYRETRARSLAVEAQVRELRTERESLKRQADEVNSMLTEDQRRTLNAAHLILDRKNFSWSRLFADLESTLPQQVRVSRITVRDISQAGGRTRADLELAVAAKTAPDVTRMMAQMAASGIFAADLLTQTPETRGGGSGIEATLRVRYSPRVRPRAPPVEPPDGALRAPRVLAGAEGARVDERTAMTSAGAREARRACSARVSGAVARFRGGAARACSGVPEITRPRGRVPLLFRRRLALLLLLVRSARLVRWRPRRAVAGHILAAGRTSTRKSARTEVSTIVADRRLRPRAGAREVSSCRSTRSDDKRAHGLPARSSPSSTDESARGASGRRQPRRQSHGADRLPVLDITSNRGTTLTSAASSRPGAQARFVV